MKEKILYIPNQDEYLKVSAINNKIIRFHFSKDREWRHNYSFAIEKEILPIDFISEENEFLISTSFLKISMDKNNGNIKIYDRENNLILADYENLGYKRVDKKVYCYKEIKEETAFLGFGERTGDLNKKGKKLMNWNTDNPHHTPDVDHLYQSHPFFLAWNPQVSYGIFFDNTYRSYFDMGGENENYYYFFAEDGELDYYFIYGPTPKEVIEGYTELTGRCYLPTIWALGYQQSRWSYKDENEVKKIAERFKEENIPCNVIYLDIDYMDGFRVFTIDKNKFPNFEKMIEELNKEGFRVVPIIDPGVKKDDSYEVYKEGIEKNYFCKKENGEIFVGHVWPGESVFPDFVREEVRKWWGEKQRILLEKGISGIWNDMNEPSIIPSFDYKMMRLLFYHLKFKEPPRVPSFLEKEDFYSKTLSADVVHGENKEFPHDEIHNVYGLLMAKASFEGWRDAKPEERPLIITRAGFSGIQKYSAVWTGDNKSAWEHLYMSIIMLQNLGISGVPFIGADVGGFWGDCEPELFARWIELGIFYPFFRNHSAINTKNQEPWEFGEHIEDIARKYIKLRYKLMPYLYSLFYEAKEKGTPILRSLILEFPKDPNAIKYEDEFMFGPSFLVAPIYEKGKNERDVYLPEGTWYNFWNNETFKGANIVKVEAPLDIIPIFVKAGSIIPMRGEGNKIELRVYPGEGEFLYYEDDGISWDYEKGIYNLVRFSLSKDKLSMEYIHKGFKETEFITSILNG